MNGGLTHGGDPGAAEAVFGRPADAWLDLSTGINPVPYPVDGIDAAVWRRLPTRADLDALLAAARACYGAPPAAGLVAAPGTQALIQRLPELRPEGTVAVVGPTYNEHAHRWRDAGHEVAEVAGLDAADADVVVLVNPNNPDGRTVAPDTVAAAAARQAERGGWLIVDEAFADVTPGLSAAGSAGTAGLLILRSFGKFFGLAGLRLGFALGDAALVGRLADVLGPWAVAGPALAIGRRALADGDWQRATRGRLGADRARLDGLLRDAGLRVRGGTDLFRLAESDDADALYRRLGAAGILVRTFDHAPGWVRFGLPGDETDWTRLAAALSRR